MHHHNYLRFDNAKPRSLVGKAMVDLIAQGYKAFSLCLVVPLIPLLVLLR